MCIHTLWLCSACNGLDVPPDQGYPYFPDDTRHIDEIPRLRFEGFRDTWAPEILQRLHWLSPTTLDNNPNLPCRMENYRPFCPNRQVAFREVTWCPRCGHSAQHQSSNPGTNQIVSRILVSVSGQLMWCHIIAEANLLPFLQNIASQAGQQTSSQALNYQQNTNPSSGQHQSNAPFAPGSYTMPFKEAHNGPDLFDHHTGGSNAGAYAGSPAPIQPSPTQPYCELWFPVRTTFTEEDVILDTQNAVDKQAKAALEEQFPRMRPHKYWKCQLILGESFQLDSRTCGMNKRITLPQRVAYAVIAHARHKHTEYDILWERGVPVKEARRRINPKVREVVDSWRPADRVGDGPRSGTQPPSIPRRSGSLPTDKTQPSSTLPRTANPFTPATPTPLPRQPRFPANPSLNPKGGGFPGLPPARPPASTSNDEWGQPPPSGRNHHPQPETKPSVLDTHSRGKGEGGEISRCRLLGAVLALPQEIQICLRRVRPTPRVHLHPRGEI